VRARLEAQCSLDIRDLLAAYDAQAARLAAVEQALRSIAKIPCLSDLLGEYYDGQEACGCAHCQAVVALAGAAGEGRA